MKSLIAAVIFCLGISAVAEAQQIWIGGPQVVVPPPPVYYYPPPPTYYYAPTPRFYFGFGVGPRYVGPRYNGYYRGYHNGYHNGWNHGYHHGYHR